MTRASRVLVVDDSGVYRAQIKKALEADPGFRVEAVAAHGREALEHLQKQGFDLVVTDLEMPVMTGLELLEEMKKLRLDVPTLVFSMHSRRGADLTLRALAAGAFDFALKPAASADLSPTDAIGAQLLPALRQMANLGPRRPEPGPRPAPPAPVSRVDWSTFVPELVVVAASTGGPTALDEMFAALRPPLPFAMLIAQHMPPVFTASLAARLARATGLDVAEARDGEPVVAGRVYVAPGDYHLRVRGPVATVELRQTPPRHSVRPAADELFETAAEVGRARTLGIVLTGMGEDGLAGADRIKRRGGPIVIQSRETCVVFGMPGAVEAAGLVDRRDSPRAIGLLLARLGKPKESAG